MELEFSKRWETERLGAFFYENSVKNLDWSESSAYQFYFGSIVPKKQYELTAELIETYKGYTKIQPGDIIINGLNLNYDFVSQRVGLAKEPGIITSAYLCLRQRDNLEQINLDYYLYLLKAVDAQKMIHGLGTGIRKTLSYADLKNLYLPVPPREEQDQIVRFLDWKVSGINALISSYKKAIASYREIRQTLIDQAVIRGMGNTPLVKAQNIPWNIEYPSHWEIKRMRESFTFRKGLTITKANLLDSGVPVISYGQVHSKENSGVGLSEELFRYVNPLYIETNKNALVQLGDLIFADTSEDFKGCGSSVYIDKDEDIFAGYHTIIAHPNSTISGKYFAYLFQSSQWRYQIRKQVNGVKVYSITQRILKDAYFLIPPKHEQQQIVGYLDEKCMQLEHSIRNLEDRIILMHEFKNRLIADVVTGKIDVRGIDIPEYETVEEIEDSFDEDPDDEFMMEEEED